MPIVWLLLLADPAGTRNPGFKEMPGVVRLPSQSPMSTKATGLRIKIASTCVQARNMCFISYQQLHAMLHVDGMQV